jgi:hypothetical protein
VQGTLVQPIDILDLIMHGAPFVVLALKGWRAVQAR